MLTFNYHTHTRRCRHAQGTERDYIETAIAAGMKTLGFSDHAPQLFPGDYYSDYRMFPEETEDYAMTLAALREEYKDRIDIRIGYEAEYYPDIFPALLEHLKKYPCDYLILGQHFLFWMRITCWMNSILRTMWTRSVPESAPDASPMLLTRNCRITWENGKSTAASTAA